MSKFNDLTREELVTLRDRYLELIREEVELFGIKPTELRHLIGRLGELQCILDTSGKISNSANQKGFDVVAGNGRRISVKVTAQKIGFVNISKSTCDLVDDLCVYQFVNGTLTLAYHGSLEAVLPLCLASQDGKKYELALSKLRKLNIVSKGVTDGQQLLHLAPLNELVQRIRTDKGAAAVVPAFDPADGGTDAEVLFLLEAPGPKATQYISRNNPDPTARNFLALNEQARIDRRRTVTWNVVPWYIGNEGRTKIRGAKQADFEASTIYLKHLLSLLPRLSVVVLLGKPAQKAELLVHTLAPYVSVIKSRHPSNQSLNRSPQNRGELLSSLQQVAVTIG